MKNREGIIQKRMAKQQEEFHLTELHTSMAMKVTKKERFCIKTDEDKPYACACDISGIAVTEDGRLLIVDITNGCVKLFSQDGTFLSSTYSIPFPWDVVVISSEEAAVGGEKTLAILDISTDEIEVKRRHKIGADSVHGIVNYKDKFAITCPYNPREPSVKLIDTDGKIYWSVSGDMTGKPLFDRPWYVKHHVDERSGTVIVSDVGNDFITKLNADTGEVIARREIRRKNPRGLTSDGKGNIFVCYSTESRVTIFSPELEEERPFLSETDGLDKLLRTIAYDVNTDRLLLSYSDCDYIDSFTLHRSSL